MLNEKSSFREKLLFHSPFQRKEKKIEVQSGSTPQCVGAAKCEL